MDKANTLQWLFIMLKSQVTSGTALCIEASFLVQIKFSNGTIQPRLSYCLSQLAQQFTYRTRYSCTGYQYTHIKALHTTRS